ncbi:hypothetical protein SANTM175S_09321 [Streptomyces antimycoticus]
MSAGSDAVPDEVAGEAVGAGVELPVGDGGVALDDGRHRAGGVRLEEGRHRPAAMSRAEL